MRLEMKMGESLSPKGVLGEVYSESRRSGRHAAYRYDVRARVLSDAIARHLGTSISLRVLDLGAADGLTLLRVSSVLPHGSYIGVEYSEELIRAARDLPPNIRLVKGDVTELPEEIKAIPFDVISALAVLEHLGDPLKALVEASSVLRPGGLFVGTAPHPFWDEVATRLGLLKGIDHVTELSKHRIVSLIEEAGMHVLDFERFMWAPVGALPYLGLPVSAGLTLAVDRFIRRLEIFNWLFVNQCIIARKPLWDASTLA